MHKWLGKVKTHQPQWSPKQMGESGFRNPENFCLWIPESWALESRIQLNELGISLMTEMQNPKFHRQKLKSSTRHPESTVWNPESKIC